MIEVVAAYFGVYDKIPTYEKTHRKHHHGLAHCIQPAFVVPATIIGVVLCLLSALRSQRYGRRHCGKNDNEQSIRGMMRRYYEKDDRSKKR